MSGRNTPEPLPSLTSDEEAERFIDEADLTAFDTRGMTPARFEFERKSARVNMRLPQSLLDAVKAKAQARGIPYQRFIREVLERAIANRGP